MICYEDLLLEILRRVDEKADKLIDLLKVSQNAEHSGNYGTNTNHCSPDSPK